MRAAGLLFIALTSCTGELVQRAVERTPVEPVVDPGPCVVSAVPSASSMQRLTQAQFTGIVQQLLSVQVDGALLPGDVKEGLFPSNGSTSVTADIAERYLVVAEAVADEVQAHAADYAPCASGEDHELCAGRFFDRFGRLVFRRAVDDGARGRYLALYRAEAAETDYAGGVSAMVAAALESPNFLYRLEPIPAGADPDTVTDYELDPVALANRLSFLVWNLGPDDALLTQAESEGLSADRITEQVQRMVADDSRKHTTAVFAEAWAGLDELPAAAGSPERLGGLSPALIPQLQQETWDFVDGVLKDPQGAFADLMTSSQTHPGALVLQEIYGAAAPQADQRSGLLTLPAVMFARAHSDQTSPVLRGKWLRENVLCLGVPPPPADVMAVVSAPSPDLTTRERSLQHRDDPSCAGCHALLDDVGFGFEHYDQYGRFRATESGKPIDATGELFGTDIDGPFDGALALGQKVAQSPLASQCFSKLWFRYALGREAKPSDACLVQHLADTMQPGQGGYPGLLRQLATSDVFRMRRAP